MTRDELIEKMARAICTLQDPQNKVTDWEDYLPDAHAALTALEAAGVVLWESKSEACNCCHRPATHKCINSFGSSFLCDDCIADCEAEADAVEAHELRNFGGAYGLPERMSYEPLHRPIRAKP